MEARCQCGLTQFQIPFAKPMVIGVCHCNKCKLITGSVYNIAAVFPYFDFPPESASQHMVITKQDTDSGNALVGHFCKGCGNRMAHTQPGSKDFVSVSAPRIVDFDWKLLQDKDLTMHCWTKSAVVPIPEGMRSFEEQPFAQNESDVKILEELQPREKS